MNDRDLQVLEQYPFTVRGSFRVRGAFLLDTSEGRRLIREYSGSVQKLETEQKLLLHLQEQGRIPPLTVPYNSAWTDEGFPGEMPPS